MTTITTNAVIAVLASLACLTAPAMAIAAPDGEGRGSMRSERGAGSVERSPQGRGDSFGDRRGGGERAWRGDGRRGADVDVRVRDRGWRGPGYRDRIRRGQRYAWGPGFAFYFTDGYYYGDCQWLKRRARETGSRTWWRRYERCRDYN